MKHTPGPWHRLTGGNISNIVTAGWASPKHHVCKITRSNCNENSNSQLIAAAPDLLEACEYADCILRYMQHKPMGYDWNENDEEALEKVKAAIAKATGKETRP